MVTLHELMLNIFIELPFNLVRMVFWKLCLVVKTKGGNMELNLRRSNTYFVPEIYFL